MALSMILIKKITYDGLKGKISISYTNGYKKVDISDCEPPRPEFIKALKNLSEIGVSILSYPFSIKDRLMITGAKFTYENDIVDSVVFLGQYVLPTREVLKQNFPKRYCRPAKKKINLSEAEQQDIDKFVEECKLYVLGERAQTKLQANENK